MIRRRLALLIASALLAAPHGADAALPDIFSYRAHDLAGLRAGFATPPAPARPWVHWFWWHNVLSRDEIARELREMAQAGFGGAEIRIATTHGWPRARALAGMDAASIERIGHRTFEYLSPEWVELMEFTCQTAESLGLRLAINLGQGWPPGGTWITDEHRSKHLVWESLDLPGGTVLHRADLPTGTFVLAWRLRADGNDVEPGSFLDLSGHLAGPGGGSLHWQWTAPPGRWLVGIFTVRPGGLCDKGEGPEVDPASAAAVHFHLQYLFDRLDPKLHRFYGRTLVDAASDSWEYEPVRRGAGRYWSPAIPAAFPRLTGRELPPRLHALLGFGPDRDRTLAELAEVERQLVRDHFLGTVAGFLHARGLRHRPQLYGRGLHRDLLEAYTLADTPEVEPGDYCVPEAVWAARTTGKPIVSAESFTHLADKMGRVRRPHREWESAPAHLRGAANDLFARGVNRIQFHSFSYSPPDVPYPGWRMYAGIQLNRNTPWWPHLAPLTTWLARQHWLLQAGQPVSDALFYPVESDPPNGPFRRQAQRQPVSAENALDGANRHTLAAVAAAHRTGRYAVERVVVLEPIVNATEAEHLIAFAERGVRLVGLNASPGDWPVFRTPAHAPLARRLAALLPPDRVQRVSAAHWQEAADAARSVRWTPSAVTLVHQRRRVAGAEVYFLANFGADFAGEVSFPHPGTRIEIWDTDTGTRRPAGTVRDHDGRAHLALRLAHAESTCLVFIPGEPRAAHATTSPAGDLVYTAEGQLQLRTSDAGTFFVSRSDGAAYPVRAAAPPAPLPIAGPWTLSVSARQALSPHAPFTRQLQALVPWHELPELQRYAGAATYATGFTLPPAMTAADIGVFLELGAVYELAQVTLNGRDAGTAWHPPFRLDVTGLVQPGQNTLQLEVPNQMRNGLADNDPYLRPLAPRSPAGNSTGGGPLRPSGILGPVRLVAERRLTVFSTAAAPP